MKRIAAYLAATALCAVLAQAQANDSPWIFNIPAEPYAGGTPPTVVVPAEPVYPYDGTGEQTLPRWFFMPGVTIPHSELGDEDRANLEQTLDAIRQGAVRPELPPMEADDGCDVFCQIGGAIGSIGQFIDSAPARIDGLLNELKQDALGHVRAVLAEELGAGLPMEQIDALAREIREKLGDADYLPFRSDVTRVFQEFRGNLFGRDPRNAAATNAAILNPALLQEEMDRIQREANLDSTLFMNSAILEKSMELNHALYTDDRLSTLNAFASEQGSEIVDQMNNATSTRAALSWLGEGQQLLIEMMTETQIPIRDSLAAIAEGQTLQTYSIQQMANVMIDEQQQRLRSERQALDRQVRLGLEEGSALAGGFKRSIEQAALLMPDPTSVTSLQEQFQIANQRQ